MPSKATPHWDPEAWTPPEFDGFSAFTRADLIREAGVRGKTAAHYIERLEHWFRDFLSFRASARTFPSNADAAAACVEIERTARELRKMLDAADHATRFAFADALERNTSNLPRPRTTAEVLSEISAQTPGGDDHNDQEMREHAPPLSSRPMTASEFGSFMLDALDYVATVAADARSAIRVKPGKDRQFSRPDATKFALQIAEELHTATGRDPCTDAHKAFIRSIEILLAEAQTLDGYDLQLRAEAIVAEALQHRKEGTLPDYFG